MDRIGGTAFLVVAILTIWKSWEFPMGTLQKPGAAFMPMILAVFLGGISLLLILLGGKSPPLQRWDLLEIKKIAAILGTCAFAALALERLGYRVTIALTLACLLGLVERNRVFLVLAVAVCFSLLSFWVFTRLGIILPRGPLSI